MNTMVLFNYNTGEAEDIDEREKGLTLNPVVLPAITMTLKRAWKANRENLEKAGMFDFLCWVQSATRVAYVAQVTQFLQTYAPDTETAQVDDKTIDFSAQVVARHLKLPMDGLRLGEMSALNSKQYEAMFEGEFVKTPRGCPLDKAKHHWRLWLKFVNDYLIFRPRKDMLAQQVVVAAMHTWNGKRVNWAQIVHQKTVEEVQRYREGEPKPKEVYSAFYISIYCQTLPPRVIPSGSPTSSVPTPSPLSSPEKVREEVAGLRRQLEQCQEALQEKRVELIEKTEALIKCQSANVKHIYELAQAMKEKMEDQAVIEGHNKTIDLLQNQVAEKEKENVTLRQQVRQLERQLGPMERDRSKEERITQENESLKEKLTMQEAEVARYKTMLKQKQVAADGQSSKAPTEAKLVQSPVLPTEFFVELWNWESKDREPRGLLRMYERHCQFFMLLTGLERGTWVDHSRFQQVWQQSVAWGVENLFVEMLARREIYLSDPYSAFVVIGDLGARVLLYYTSLESQWLLCHQVPVPVEKRKASWQEYGLQVNSQFYSQPLSKLQPWEDNLHTLLV